MPFIAVHLLSCVQLFVKAWTVAHQASLSFAGSWNLLILMPTESVMLSNISSSATLLALALNLSQYQGNSNQGSPMNQLFISGSRSIGESASASIIPMNIQGWFPLGWTSLISLLSKELSRVFSNTTIQKHQ